MTDERDIDIVQYRATLKCLVIELRQKDTPDPAVVEALLDQAEVLLATLDEPVVVS